MGFFSKIGRAFRHAGGIFRKGGNEISSVFRKGGNTIARGLGGMAGAGAGGIIGGALGSLAGPEGTVIGSQVGRLIGGVAGSEGAGRIETTTRGLTSGKGKFTTKPFPPRRLGQNGGGIYRGNSLEKSKPSQKQNFV